MNRRLLAGLVLACLGGGAADAAEPSLCTQLADKARQLPPAAWSKPEPLARWLQPSRRSSPRKLSPTEEALASDARWRERIGASPDGVVGVDHLAGTPVYLMEHLAGTANCQSLALIEALRGQPARELALPFKLEGMDLCTTQSAQFAQVLGRPALVVSGAPSMISPDRHYRISAWTHQGWGRACRLELRLHGTMAPARRFCAPGAAVCDAGQAVAQQLAQAYDADRKARQPLDDQRFAASHQPDAAVLVALNPPLAEPGAVVDFNLPLPLFGADDKGLDAMQTQFSNADPRRLPVLVDGRWWLAVVGRGGVGWREGNAILVTFFAPPGRPGDAVASYQFLTGPVGLREAVASDDRP